MAAEIVERLKRGLIALEKRKVVPAPPAPAPPTYVPWLVPYPEVKEEKPKVPPEGIEIKPVRPTRRPVREVTESLVGLDVRYPLIPRLPGPHEPVYASAHIKWEPKMAEVVYHVIEPPLSADDKEAIEKIKADLEERLDIDFSRLGVIAARELLRSEIAKSMRLLGLKFDETKQAILTYYIERDTIGLSKIEPLMADPNIEDISCDGVGIPIFIYHRDPKLASMRTDVVFDNSDELNSFVIKLAQRCNKTISIAEPLLDGTLPDGSRVQATLGTDIARKGSNFTIRRFTEKPLTPAHMLRYKTLDSTQLAYLWLAVEHGQSILVSGGTATGKTSLLNVLSLFIRPTLKVVSIEDTSELRLHHPHWIPHVARSPISVKGRIGEVTLFDLLKSSLRQRPDYIIVGEVRGEEAFVLFQQIATGHPGLATIHAATIPQLIDRLTTPPIKLPPSLLENIDIIIFLVLSRLKEQYVRRSDSILEVTGVEKGRPVTNKVFEWRPITDSYEIVGKSVVLKKIARRAGLTEDSIKQELMVRKAILEWMLEQEIFDYKEATSIIQAYYTTPERVLDMVGI